MDMSIDVSPDEFPDAVTRSVNIGIAGKRDR